MTTQTNVGNELSADLLRRVLLATAFEYTDSLFWRDDDGHLVMFASCSDFFALGCADVEPIESQADVIMLEASLRDLRDATGESYPLWVTELYAARRRRLLPAPFMFDGKYAMSEKVQGLFRDAAEMQPVDRCRFTVEMSRLDALELARGKGWPVDPFEAVAVDESGWVGWHKFTLPDGSVLDLPPMYVYRQRSVGEVPA